MKLKKRLALVAGVALVAAACSGDGDTAGDEGVLVVATTTVLGEIVANVAGDAAAVEVLMPTGVDPHDFQASARQVARMEEADLIVAVGLGLEQGLGDVLTAMEADGHAVFRIGEHTERLRVLAGGEPDPHVWLDPLLMATAVETLAGELESIAPGGGWPQRAAAYAAALEDLDAQIRTMLAGIPNERRVLVTNHDSLGYFADTYDLKVVGVVVPGGSTLAAPSSAHLADLVAAIDRAGVPAVFAETTNPATLAESVAAEAAGDVTVVELLIGSLGGPGAETYVDMLRTNARRIAEVLG